MRIREREEKKRKKDQNREGRLSSSSHLSWLDLPEDGRACSIVQRTNNNNVA